MSPSDKNDIHSKIADLQKRAEEARPKETSDEMLRKKNQENNENESHAGSEFLGTVIAGGLLGYGIDWYAGTTPWGMLFFIVMGFVSGVYRANAAMKQEYKTKAEKNIK